MNTTSKPITTLLVTIILAVAARLGFKDIPSDAVYTVAGGIISLAAYFLGKKHGATSN